MNIFRRELKANLKSLIIWCVIMGLFILLGISKFSAYFNNPQMLEILNALPKQFIDAMSLKAFNLTTVSGFYGIMFVYFALMGAIAAALWGSDAISKEERDKTVEFSLVLPVTRSEVITAKALAALVNCIVLVLFTWLVSFVFAQRYNPEPAFNTFLFYEMVAMFLIELVFLAIGLLLGASLKYYKRSASIGIAIILVTYFLSILSGLQKNLEFLGYFSPFKYFDPARLLNSATTGSLSGALSGTYLLLAVGIIIVCVAASYLTYNRRDLYI